MAGEATTELVRQVRQDSELDISESVALARLDAAHKLMVVRSKCYRRVTAVGDTVVDQSDYLMPGGVIEVVAVDVGGTPYDRVGRSDVVMVKSALAVFVGPNGVVAQGANGTAEETLTLFPAPDADGDAISVFGPVRAPSLDESSQDPVVPEEFFDGLVAGAVGETLRRQENRHDLADAWMARFDGATEELRRQVRRRWNVGPARIRVAWP